MVKNYALFLSCFLILVSSSIKAIDNDKPWNANFQKQKVFIENKGQFRLPSETTLEPSAVKFAYDGGSTMIYFTPNGITYSFLKAWREDKEDKDKPKDEQEYLKERYKEIKRESKEAEEGRTRNEIEGEERYLNFKTDVVTMFFENSNANVQLLAENVTPDYHSYLYKENGEEKNENYIKAFKKITYKNIYPNIDIEYTFHPEIGIKYAVILHPGADATLLKMNYDKNVKINNAGEVLIDSKFGDIIDHAPITFYQNNKSEIITSRYIKTLKTISFELGNYDNSKTVIIDPWVQTPAFATNWDCVWECERDGAGNAYLIGGVMPLQLIKYNAAGVIQWTYSTPYDTSEWLGTFATDLAGNSYVTEGSQARIQKVSTAGAVVWNNPNPGGLFSSTEFWNISFNCDQTRLVIGGTGNLIPPLPYIYNVDMSNGNVLTSVQVTAGALFPTQEVRSITASSNGRYYFLSHDSIGYINQNFTLCPGTGPTSIYHINSGYSLGYKCENFRVDNSGIMAIRANRNFCYSQNGANLQKRSLSTLAVIATVAIPGGVLNGGFGGNNVGNSGIDIDSCGNVYVGSTNAVIKYDANLVQLASQPTTYNVYDVAVSTGGNVIACGTTGNSGTGTRTGKIQSFAMTACSPMIQFCCDATICNHAPFCVTDPAVNLVAASAGGVWSGLGITNPATGTFNPATAGPGSHTVYYTLSCGLDSATFIVNNCTPLVVCQNTNGTLTVTGGSGPYNWQSQVTTTPCVFGFGNCGGPLTVAGAPVTNWVTFATGSTVTVSVPYPIQVVDNSGTVFSILNLAAVPLCSACPTLTVNITSQVNVACNGQSTGSFNAATTGGASPYSYTLMNGATTVATFNNIAGTQAFTGLSAGTYTLNVVDANACPGTTTIIITQPAAATVAAAGPNQTVCGPTATLAGNTATVGTGTWSLISGAGNITTPLSPTSGVTALGAGANVFQWTISNAPCPSTTSQVTITSDAGPTVANAGPNQTICATTATLAGNIALVGTGTWTLVSGAGTITNPALPNSGVTGLGIGANVFQWTITNGSCPPSTSQVTINSSGAANAAVAGPNQTLCGTTTTTLAGNTPASGTGTWSLVSGTGSITTPNSATSGVTGLGVGVNVFMWTISSPPCLPTTSNDTITVVAAPTVSVAGPNQSLCSSSATFAGNTAVIGTGVWTLVSGTGTITNPNSLASAVTNLGLGANVFQWTISNAPCPASSSQVTITNTGGASSSISGPAQTVCGTTATLAGNIPAIGVGTWTLVSGASTITTPSSATSGVTGLGVGLNVFQWTIVNAPCPNTTSLDSITVVNPPTVSIAGANQTGCNTLDTLAGNTPTVGVGTWTLISGTGTITNPALPNSSVTGLGVGANVFEWTITNAPCAPSSSQVTIANTGGATINITAQTNVLCFGNATGSVTSNTTGGASPYDYVWTGTAGVLQTANNITVPNTLSGLIAGTYTLTVTDNAGCITIQTVTITQPSAALTLAVTNFINASCGNNNGSGTVLASGGTVGTGYSYSWAPSGGSNASATNLGANTYTVTATDANGCTTTNTVTITNTTGPAISITNQINVLCNGASTGSATSTVVGGTGTLTYLWAASGGTNATATNLSAGTYTVTVTDGSGCAASTTVTITQPPVINGNVIATPAGCTTNTGTATISATGGFGTLNYVWSPGGANTATITNLAAGTYNVTITDLNGCTTVSSGIVGTLAGPGVDAGSSTSIQQGGSATLTGSGGVAHIWNPGATLSCDTCLITVATPTVTTTYTLTVTDVNGCSASDTVTVFVQIPCPENKNLQVPNAFSPNNDGSNDNFCLQGWNNCITGFTITIFDRWGEKVFESAEPDFCWDGIYKGKPLDPAVFVYYIKAYLRGTETIDRKGNISLIR